MGVDIALQVHFWLICVETGGDFGMRSEPGGRRERAFQESYTGEGTQITQKSMPFVGNDPNA